MDHFIQRVPTGFAVTHGRSHVLTYANAAFGNLMTMGGHYECGVCVRDALPGRDTTALEVVLDRAYRTGTVERDRPIGFIDAGAAALLCTVWPDVTPAGDSQNLLVEVRRATQDELTIAIQREVRERLLVSALQAQDAADAAEVSRRVAAILAVESRRLAASLDENATLAAMARMSLPYLGAWCIVDTLAQDGSMHRIAMIHSDPIKQMLFDEIAGSWIPALSDGFGLATILLSGGRSIIGNDSERPLIRAASNDRIERVLEEVGDRPLLTVPLVIRDRIAGAVTFVGGRDGQTFTREDIKLAEDLASRSATALDRARLYGEAVGLREAAEAASEAKSTFLSRMSHELRTPLNAIGGFVDLLEMEIRGPITAQQRQDLGRIKRNQLYLTGLIADLLNYSQVGGGQLTYAMEPFDVEEALHASVTMVESLVETRGLKCFVQTSAMPMMLGDREKVQQVLVNLLANAIKFTQNGGEIHVRTYIDSTKLSIEIRDTGIGIPADKIHAIFEAFVQVRNGSTASEPGIGLGLAISRSLAQGMQGDLTATSVLGVGSAFTLELPLRATAPAGHSENGR
jgi:signal transduction histidine kinase